MACLYCGKEIGPFRLLRDTEFCSSAHRKDYRARLGKALGQIAVTQPPPAPPAGFIPYQPPSGSNRNPSMIWTFAAGEAEVRLPVRFPVSVVSRLGENAAPLSWPKAFPAAPAVACTIARAPRCQYGAPAYFPQLTLTPESRLPGIAELTAADPLPADPLLLQASAVNAGSRTHTADPFRPCELLDLPAESLPAPPHAMCNAVAGPAAQPVESWLPLPAAPQAIPFATTAVAPRWVVAAAELAYDLAHFVESPSPQAVESFLPAPAEPQIVTYPAAAQLPQFSLAAVELVVTGDLAEPVASPAAQAVESFLPAPAEPQIVASPAAVLLPQFSLAAADWHVAADLAEPVASPAAQAVESFLPAPAEPQIVSSPAAALLPRLSLSAVEMAITGDLAEAVPAPSAQAVEAFLPLPAEPAAMRFATATRLPQLPMATCEWLTAAGDQGDRKEPVSSDVPQPSVQPALPYPISVAHPQLALAAADWMAPSPLAEAVPASAAEVVESFLPLAPEPQPAAYPAALAAMPRLQLDAAEWTIFASLADAVASPAAQAVESFLPMAAEPAPVLQPIAVSMPLLSIGAAEWIISASLADAVASPAAQAVESFLAGGVEANFVALPTPVLQLPQLTLTAEAEPVEEFIPPIVVSALSEEWMPSLQAGEVMRDVIPALIGPLPVVAAVQAPGAAHLAMEQPMIRWAGGWQISASAEPVSSYISPLLQGAVTTASQLCLPTLRSLQTSQRNIHSARGDFAAAPADTVEVAPPAAAQVSGAEATRWPAPIQLGGWVLEQSPANQSAEFQPAQPAAMEPPAGRSEPAAAEIKPSLGIHIPLIPAQAHLGLPQRGPAAMEFFCQRAAMSPVHQLEWQKRPNVVHPPKFTLRAVAERLEPVAMPKPAPEPAVKTPAFGEIFTLRDIARRKVYTSSLSSTGKAIAASMLVGIGLWFGAGSARILRQLQSINTNFSSIAVPASGEDTAPHYTAPQSPSGPIATIRRVIRQRASLELTDTFRRMESWGATAKALPSGWSRHPDGYMRTGQMALFKPTQAFTDYRLEFFGAIEKKGMGWAVRARDTDNYYAMKFTVVEPGLRPVIAVEHYPVLGGKKGRRVETPLAVMVHNHEPYHVAVDVKGNRVVTSIEGQEVDAFTDDSLKSGGVGFFSDVGESARLYWIRVTKNQDWLGRVCAYLSGGSATDTAELWRDIPGMPSQPSQPSMPSGADAVLAAAETEEFSSTSPLRGRILKYGRTELCRS